MDADSSYGGSDTAQDSHSGHDNSSSLDANQQQEPNNFYHKNEITLPVNYDEADFQESKTPKQPHYLSTANLNINDTLEHHSNLEEMSKNYKSTSYLNESPRIRKKSESGVDNPAFQEEEYKPEVKSTFDNNKPYNGDLNSSAMLGLTSPTKNDEPLTEAVNLELINLKPGKDVTGAYENGTNGMTSIPVKKENDAEIGNPYDEYFVPVNEHRKYMSKTRKGRNSVTFAEMIATSGVDNTGLSITSPEQGVVEYPDWLTSLENTRYQHSFIDHNTGTITE